MRPVKKRLTNSNQLIKRRNMRFLLDKRQHELAAIFDVTPAFYSRWENGLKKSSRLEDRLINYYLQRTSKAA